MEFHPHTPTNPYLFASRSAATTEAEGYSSYPYSYPAESLMNTPPEADSLFATLSLAEVMDTDGGANGSFPDGESVLHNNDDQDDQASDSWNFAGPQASKWELPDTEEALKEWLIHPAEELKEEIVTMKKGKRVKWKAGRWVEESLDQKRREQRKRRETLKRGRMGAGRIERHRYNLRRERKALPNEKW